MNKRKFSQTKMKIFIFMNEIATIEQFLFTSQILF